MEREELGRAPLFLEVCLRHPHVLETMTSQVDSDVDPTAPICIGMDYNANINWIVAGQPRGRRLNVIKSFYVKFERKIPALVEEFCRYYATHENKTVVFYYDTTALGSNYADRKGGKNTCSSTILSKVSNALCRSSTAPTMKTSYSPFSQPVSPTVATGSL